MEKKMNKEALQANLRMLNKQGDGYLEMLRRRDPAAAERIGKAGELMKDEKFSTELLAVDSAEEAVALFAGHGVNLSREEVTGLAGQIMQTAKRLIENNGELSEKDLEQIAGGWSGESAVNGAGSGLMVGGLVGTFILPGLGSVAGIVAGAGFGTLAGGFNREIKSGFKAVKETARQIGKFFADLF